MKKETVAVSSPTCVVTAIITTLLLPIYLVYCVCLFVQFSLWHYPVLRRIVPQATRWLSWVEVRDGCTISSARAKHALYGLAAQRLLRCKLQDPDTVRRLRAEHRLPEPNGAYPSDPHMVVFYQFRVIPPHPRRRYRVFNPCVDRRLESIVSTA